MTAPQSRPRVVTAAFWCSVIASVLLVAFGMLLALNTANLPVFLRGAGVLFAVGGLALGYLTGQSRAGKSRFRRAAVALGLVLGLLLALFILAGRGYAGGGILWVLPMILTIVGAVLMMRPSAQEWFDNQEEEA